MLLDNMKLAFASSLLFVLAAAQTCATTTIASNVPTNTALAFQQYSYCGGTLNASAYIENIDYDKLVNLYYTNGKNQSTPLSVIAFGYAGGVPNTNYEIWDASTPIGVDGITELLNITYQATDVSQTYNQVLNLPVNTTGSTPTSSPIPKPYATPAGFSKDITKFLAPNANSEAGIALTRMFLNIEVTNAANGTVVAAQSYANPDYGYNWVRDSSLTMDVVQSVYAAATTASQKSTYEALLFRYAIARATEQNDANQQTGLGEPKFNLDNSVFTGPWGRPQNDGAATASITLMEFSNAYLAAGGSKQTVINSIYNTSANPQAPVLKDLLFVASNWSSPSFDLWEEEESDHFYTRMVQHRALVMGSAFAKKLGDSATASTLSSQASALASTLSQFWDSARNLLLYEYGPVLRGKASFKDTAVMLGIIHGYAGDGVFNYNNPQVLASAVEIATSFISVYPIAATHFDSGSSGALGIPIGRYPEDTYDGVQTTGQGNPWYLCTTSFAEVFYRSAIASQAAGSIKVTAASLPFWNYFSPKSKAVAGATYKSGSAQFKTMIQSLQGWGDAFMRTVMHYTPSNGHLTEEINRSTGAPQGAIDLTWSYAAFLTAAFARAEAMGDTSYITTLANLPVHTNSTAP